MQLDGGVNRVRKRAHRAGEFSVAGARISRLDIVDGRAHRARIERRLRQHLNLRTERHHLRLVRRAARRKHGERFALGVGQARSGTHAERIIEHQQLEFLAVHTRGRAIDERICEGQRQQHEKQRAQGQQEADSAAGDA